MKQELGSRREHSLRMILFFSHSFECRAPYLVNDVLGRLGRFIEAEGRDLFETKKLYQGNTTEDSFTIPYRPEKGLDSKRSCIWSSHVFIHGDLRESDGGT